MTYAGLKSMMYAGLGKDDPRVKAAWGWIQKNYTVDENPGLAYAADVSVLIGDCPHNYRSCWRALNVHGELFVFVRRSKSAGTTARDTPACL